jgi:hypothetical protein
MCNRLQIKNSSNPGHSYSQRIGEWDLEPTGNMNSIDKATKAQKHRE